MNEELNEAFNAYLEANRRYADVATEELVDKVATRYPTATQAIVTAFVSEDYSEHDIKVLNERGKHLNADDDWPWVDDEIDEHWVMVVTEGICGLDGGPVTILI